MVESDPVHRLVRPMKYGRRTVHWLTGKSCGHGTAGGGLHGPNPATGKSARALLLRPPFASSKSTLAPTRRES